MAVRIYLKRKIRRWLSLCPLSLHWLSRRQIKTSCTKPVTLGLEDLSKQFLVYKKCWLKKNSCLKNFFIFEIKFCCIQIVSPNKFYVKRNCPKTFEKICLDMFKHKIIPLNNPAFNTNLQELKKKEMPHFVYKLNIKLLWPKI